MKKELENGKKLTFDKDIISSLPDNIIGTILVLLPFKDAISTSFLSRYWRYKWRSVPDIIFDFSVFYQPEIQEPHYSNNKRMDKITQVLLRHEGDIQTFDVRVYDNEDASEKLTLWFDHLVAAHVQKLSLLCQHLIPSSLFCCDMLVTLNLRGCIIVLPQSFEGFKSLTTLQICEISINATDFERWIKACPLLNFLDVDHLDLHNIKIHAPNLQFLFLEGHFTYLNLNGSSRLISAFISNNSDHCDCTNCFSTLKDLEVLHILSSLEMCKGIIFNRMKKFHLYWRTDCIKETEILFYILKCSHALEYLNITVYLVCDEKSLSAIKHFWKALDMVSFKLNQLKFLNLHEVSGTMVEMKFIKFVLGNAPSLEELCITAIDDEHDAIFDSTFLMKLLSFPRASSRAIVRFKDSFYVPWIPN